jgi:hypothetical protein
LPIEGGSESIAQPRRFVAVGEYGRDALGDACKHATQVVTERDNCLSPTSALAGGHGGGAIAADMGPAEPQEIAKP